jgi:polysaccharide biosynthesis transport protein
MKRARRLPSNDMKAIDPFGAGPAGVPEGGQEESPFAVFEKVHRLLRGRYPLAIGLALLGAALGGLGGYMATRPTYQSIGSIHIVPVLPKTLYTTELTQMPPMFNSWVRTRANLIQDPQVLDAAMASERWRALGRGISPEERERFRRSLRIVVEREEPEWIWIRFSDRDPQAAKVAVEEIIAAYVERHGAMDNIVTPQQLSSLRQRRTTLENNIREVQRRINTIGSQYGTNDLGQIHDDAVAQLRQLDMQVSQLEMEIAEAEQRLAAADAVEAEAGDGAAAPAVAAVPILPVGDIAVHDPTMRALMQSRLNQRTEVEQLRSRFGERHPTLSRARSRLEALDREIDQYAQEWLSHNPGFLPGVRLGANLSAQAVEERKAHLAALRPMLEAAHQRASELNDKRLEVDEFRDRLRREREQLAFVEQRLTELDTERPTTDAAGMSPRLNIVSRGEVPHSPAVDNRKKLAALGVMFGGGFPIGLLLLWGLMDRRYRFAEDAGSEGRVTLLGVLPYLPGAMKDPEQAGIAAHCVHQIRTLLQIAAAGQQRKVFAITSPTAGDGKTSLSLSLGLSFATSGSRTCLIDFDMIGAGLTAAMQVKTELGILDAVQEGHLNGHVRATSFARLSIVPVGEHDAQEVSRLSPAAVRRILDQAREEFDIVIVDTGPVLGSIEASLVCAEADGVVLAIGRGQHRGVADRAISHLNSIGARLVGVVFNRAQTSDFRRMMASTSIRSVPLQNGSAGPHASRRLPALGPMASTVASRFEGENEHDR